MLYYLSKKAMSAALAVQAATITALAGYLIKKEADRQKASKEAEREEEERRVNDMAEENRELYLDMEPVRGNGFVGMKLLEIERMYKMDSSICVTGPAYSGRETVELIEFLSADGTRMYLYHDTDAYRRIEGILPGDGHYSPDRLDAVFTALAKTIPGFRREKHRTGDGYFEREMDFGYDRNAQGRFVKAAEPSGSEDVAVSLPELTGREKECLGRTVKAWESNNMFQLLGRESYDSWEKQIRGISDALNAETETDERDEDV